MFSKILIANRGEIAIRIINACRSMGIKTVAVYSEADKESLHTSYADECYCIGPPSASKSYMNKEALITTALLSGSEAIHPGYGFLSEDAGFAKMCEENNIAFIGPSSDVIQLASNKFIIKQIAKSLNIPIAPAYLVNNLNEIEKVIDQIGYPVILKILNGGGGAGIHVIYNQKQVDDIKKRVTDDDNNAMYIEKYIENVKHIEVQVIGDQFGKILLLGNRDCSIQENNKKIIEECPAPSISKELRDKLYDCTYKIAQAINYNNAGTVEFLVERNEKLYLMEFNARIQVEHGITEMTTKIDIVNWQIKIAAGQKLIINQEDIHHKGHAIECRINAKTTGVITNFQYPKDSSIRFDHMMIENIRITSYYDSLIGKIMVCEANRSQAINKMKKVLENMVINGIETNIDFHRNILENQVFCAGAHLTNFISNKSYINRKIKAREKLYQIIDPDTFYEYFNDFTTINILNFESYDEKITKAKSESGESEAVITGIAKINKIECVVVIFEPLFMMGSMGVIVGEKITKAFELALRKKLPIISIIASGGARMQEGVFSLMQMVKTSAAIKKHSQKGLLSISVILNPTLGGVSASFASLADIIIAEENAVYGFTGRQIIEETMMKKLPDEFQTAEFAKRYGQVDMITNQKNLRELLTKLLNLHAPKGVKTVLI